MNNQIDNYINDLEKYKKERNSIYGSLNDSEKELYYQSDKIVNQKKKPYLITFSIITIALVLFVYILNISILHKMVTFVTCITILVCLYLYIISGIKKNVENQILVNNNLGKLKDLDFNIKKIEGIVHCYKDVTNIIRSNFGFEVEKLLSEMESVESLISKKTLFIDASKFLDKDEVAKIILQDISLNSIYDKLNEHDQLVYDEAVKQINRYMYDIIPDLDLDKLRMQFSTESNYLSLFEEKAGPAKERIRKKAAWQAEYDNFMKNHGSKMVDRAPTDGKNFCAYAKMCIYLGTDLILIGDETHVAEFSCSKKPKNDEEVIIWAYFNTEEITTHPVERKTVRVNGTEVDVSIEREETSYFDRIKIRDWVYPRFHG